MGFLKKLVKKAAKLDPVGRKVMGSKVGKVLDPVGHRLVVGKKKVAGPTPARTAQTPTSRLMKAATPGRGMRVR